MSEVLTGYYGWMNSNALAEAAVARWFSGGVTSLTHPVLAHVLADCFHPLGIEADWFEAEPFSALEAGLSDGWLRAPRWNCARIDALSPAARDLAPWTARGSEVTVTADGILRLPPAGADDPEPWLAIRHSVGARGRASAFLCAAAGSLLFDPAAAAIYRGGNDAAFVETIWARLGAAKREANTTGNKADEAEAAQMAR